MPGEKTKQAAVGRPDPAVGKPGDEEGVVGTPQDGYEENLEDEDPQGQEEPEGTKKWEWRHGDLPN
jgi:hypothetical protein